MANIRPFDLPPAPSVPSSAAFVIDTGAVVQKATAEQIVDSAVPLATQAEAETGSGNDTRMSPLRVQQAINAQANDSLLRSELAADGGSSLIGTEGGGTVQDLLPVRIPNASDTSANSTYNFQWNKITSLATASEILGGGTNQQPNLIGYRVAVDIIEGFADNQTAFPVTPGFNVPQISGVNTVNVFLRRASDGAQFQLAEGAAGSTGFTVSGYGTPTVTITTNTPVDADIYSQVRIRVIDPTTQHPTNSPLLNFIGDGYDNVIDGEGPANTIRSQHGTILNSPGGHNTLIGGSYLFADACQYHTMFGGTSNVSRNASFGFVTGRGNYQEGAGSFTCGTNNYTFGQGGICFGVNNTSTFDFTVNEGRGGVARNSGHRVRGSGKSGDTDVGIRQAGELLLSKTTTDATEGFLSAVAGSSLTPLPASSTTKIVIEGFATRSDGSEYVAFSGWALIRVTGGTSSIIAGSETVSGGTSMPLTMAGASAGASAYAARVQCASNGFYIRPTGVAGETIRWIADVHLIETSWAAP